jgi:hypothetical protein
VIGIVVRAWRWASIGFVLWRWRRWIRVLWRWRQVLWRWRRFFWSCWRWRHSVVWLGIIAGGITGIVNALAGLHRLWP